MNWHGDKGATFLQRFSALFAITITVFLLAGCGRVPTLSDRDADIYTQLHKKFSRMEAYSATVKLTVRSNKTENTYTMTQKVKSPDQAVVTLKEPASLAGVTTVFSGDFVSVSADGEARPLQVSAREAVNPLLLTDFFAMYYQSEDTALSVSASLDSQGTILLETALIPDTSERYKMSLLCDANKLEPKTLTVYDVGGNIRMIAVFSDFSYNPPLDASLFVLP